VVDQLLHDKEDVIGLLVVGAILLAMGVAFPVMGYFFSVGGERDAFYPLTGVGALLFMMGVAFVAVWAFVRRSRSAAKSDRSDA
jgi:high-affinity Fe2+/Pb2+ permease